VQITGDEIFGKPEHAKLGSPVTQVEQFIRRFCILPDAAYLTLAVWAMATYTPNNFECFPYIALLSPAKRCGKTRVLEVLELVSNGAWRGTSPSAAALYRMLENTPTLLLDEVEALNRRGASEVQQAILSILNAGHRKGATVPRCEGPKNEVRHFTVYGPKAFAAIGGLPDTLLDRSIVVSMQRRTAVQSVERLLQSRGRADAEPTRAAVESFMQEHAEDIRVAYEYLMGNDLKFLSDRDADLWLPLFAVCSAASPDRMDDLRQCSKILSFAKQSDDADDSLQLKLLADLRMIWPNNQLHVETSTLLERLGKMDESPWSTEITLTPRKLARMLRLFEVKPAQFRQDDRAGLRGYSRDALEVAWRRYL
jgi:hypothetical protein